MYWIQGVSGCGHVHYIIQLKVASTPNTHIAYAVTHPSKDPETLSSDTVYAVDYSVSTVNTVFCSDRKQWLMENKDFNITLPSWRGKEVSRECTMGAYCVWTFDCKNYCVSRWQAHETYH